ncbi:ABC transporter substrate-binding protein [Christensenellaceae bacterium OttesenSCG-928-L17]|nr:ABC transporter substrate-binding protein [Christensenellaceae bacterium OttesenSCG-928-L17]
MKKILSLLLVLSLLLSACTNGGGAPIEGPDENSVVDGTGQTLAIPQNKEDTTIATVYAVSVPFLVALELSERVVAVNVKSKFWTEADEHLAAAGSVGRGTVDLEALAELSPGVLVHRSNDPSTVEAVQGKLEIPVFCITVEDLSDIQNTLAIIGRYFGKEARAEEVAAWLDGKFAMIAELVKDIPEAEKKTALVMGGELGRVAGGDMLQSWMIEQAGGICVAKDVEENRNWSNVGVETVFEWDPDFLFCTSSTALDYTVESIQKDPVWSALAAVQREQVYHLPAKIDSWDMPGISCALGTMYMLHRMYPERMSAETLQAEIDEYYTFLFGKTFEASYLGYELGG